MSQIEIRSFSVDKFLVSVGFFKSFLLFQTGLNNQTQVLGDIRSLVETHRDSMFTGLAIARIFHGISSPNYPAIVWGRTRFWRAHLLEDFKSLVQIATVELIKFR